jgi:hypothetical protein
MGKWAFSSQKTWMLPVFLDNSHYPLEPVPGVGEVTY